MSGLSDVTVLFGQRAGDIEKAREIFTAETRNFVSAILAGVQRARKDLWLSSRIRIDFPREIETESKVGYLNNQQAIARTQLRFKKGTKYTVVADVLFGIEFDHESNNFAWQIKLVPRAPVLSTRTSRRVGTSCSTRLHPAMRLGHSWATTLQPLPN